MDYVLKKTLLYLGCSIPPIAFHLLTRKDNLKRSNKSCPEWILVLLAVVELIVPLAYDTYETTLDRTLCAVMATVMTLSMILYIRDRRNSSKEKVLAPFYEFLSRWNEAPQQKKNQHVSKNHISVAIIRQDAFKYLLRAVFYTLIYMPVFSTMDGFIRVCNEPPETFSNMSYLNRFLRGQIPIRTTFYYTWTSIDLVLHIVIVPLVHLIPHAIQLNVLAWIPNIDKESLFRLHKQLSHFVAQPPLFNKPWLTRSIYDLWSRRWHQIFRPGFHQIAYSPIRQWFGEKHAAAGKMLGTIAVFMCSGLMHDYIIFAMLGYSRIGKSGIFGYQTLFFFLQAIATIVSVYSPRLPTWLARVLTWIWVIYTAPLFMEPYVRLGLHMYAYVPGFPTYMDPYVAHICPYGVRN